MINKKSLEIKNKKILIKEEDDYLDSVKSMTSGIVGDIANFTKDSAKIVGNLSKLLAKSGWYTFRAKILGNMTDEEFKRSLKDARVDFVTNSDANIRNIDSNVLKMLSSVGVSESEINGYLLGLPGYNVLENINVSSFLTGRKYKKDKFNKLNPFEFTAEEIILFFMINNLNSATGGSISQPNNSQVKKVLTDNVSKKQSIITQLKKTLNNKISNDFLEIINKEVIKKKNKDYFNLVKKSLKGTTFLSYKISKDEDATRFFAHIKSTFSIVVKKSTKKKTTSDTEADSSSQEPTSEMFDKLSLRINNNNLTLITEKDEFELDEYRKTVCELLDTIAASTVLINTDISKIILGEQLEEIQEGLEDAKDEVQESLTDEDKDNIQSSIDNNKDTQKNLSFFYFLISDPLYRFNFYETEIAKVNNLLIKRGYEKIKDLIGNFGDEFVKNFLENLEKEKSLIDDDIKTYINDYVNIMKNSLEKSFVNTDIGNFLNDKKIDKDRYDNSTPGVQDYLKDLVSNLDVLKNTSIYLNTINEDIKVIIKDMEEINKDNNIPDYCDIINSNEYNNEIKELAKNLKTKHEFFKSSLGNIKNYNLEGVRENYEENYEELIRQLNLLKEEIENNNNSLKL